MPILKVDAHVSLWKRIEIAATNSTLQHILIIVVTFVKAPSHEAGLLRVNSSDYRSQIELKWIEIASKNLYEILYRNKH